jgi:hypothetical protein
MVKARVFLASLALVAFSLAPLESRALESALTLKRNLTEDLREMVSKPIPFDAQVSLWKERYGARTITALSELAFDRKLDEHSRYMAWMGALKLGGSQVREKLSELSRDSSWLLRQAALESLEALSSSTASGAKTDAKTEKDLQIAIQLLKDKALLVRLRAIETISKLRPEGSRAALLETLKDAKNYVAGRALGAPKRALRVLKELGGENSYPEIQALLKKVPDAAVRAEIRTLKTQSVFESSVPRS